MLDQMGSGEHLGLLEPQHWAWWGRGGGSGGDAAHSPLRAGVRVTIGSPGTGTTQLNLALAQRVL